METIEWTVCIEGGGRERERREERTKKGWQERQEKETNTDRNSYRKIMHNTDTDSEKEQL